ncbi:MAG TPA: 3-hydroxyacyl-ACP dehydratase FabZ [Bdellovibrionota bacterium]|jgi:3-hydroxyacyl-[acyl-carrier-protein] dehydratase
MSKDVKKYGPYDHLQIMSFLPHRYPFLFVDRIISVEVPYSPDGKLQQVGTRVVGIKNATINEPYFTGHFPKLPITPGVVIIETMAQISSFAIMPWLKVDKDMRILSKFDLRLAGVDNTRFRRPFSPGECLKITIDVTKQRGPIWGFKCHGEVDGQPVVEADVLASAVVED